LKSVFFGESLLADGCPAGSLTAAPADNKYLGGSSEDFEKEGQSHKADPAPLALRDQCDRDGLCHFFHDGQRYVLAQDTAEQDTAAEMDEIIVTGIRKSIEDSITAKKNEQSIVEVVSAEDIGKLPDSSIAESIARLPGIAAQRTNGRAQTLSIRGLGPDFTVTTFNGREQATTTTTGRSNSTSTPRSW
jgi:hypothetical protein